MVIPVGGAWRAPRGRFERPGSGMTPADQPEPGASVALAEGHVHRAISWRGTATGVLAKGREGPVFTSIELEVELVTDLGDEARAQAVLATAERSCIVSRALTAPVRVTSKVTAAPGGSVGYSDLSASI